MAISLFVLAAWIAGDAVRALWTADRPEISPVGMALTLTFASLFRAIALASAVELA